MGTMGAPTIRVDHLGDYYMALKAPTASPPLPLWD